METNRTEAGVGGEAHTHDYWAGRERVTIADVTATLARVAPPLPDGPGSQPRGVAIVKIPPPGLVYEGTIRLEILVSEPHYDLAGPPLVVPAPIAPPVTIERRTAADASFRDAQAVTFGTPLVYDVAAVQTDMPHSMASLWAFRATTDRSDLTSFKVTVTIVRGADPPSWPGHPDFYAEAPTRTVLDADVHTKHEGIEQTALYGNGHGWIVPQKLISFGTKSLQIEVTLQGIQTARGVPPDGYYLEIHNATDFGDEQTEWPRYEPISRDGSMAFHALVDPNGMDGPYQPESRWGLRLQPTYGGQACPGCIPYEIQYSIKVVASG